MGVRGRVVCWIVGGALIMIALPWTGDAPASAPASAPAESYIVQARDLAAAAGAVRAAGGEITHELGIIGAVGARLSAEQHARLAETPAVRQIYGDAAVRVSTTSPPIENVQLLAVADTFLKQDKTDENNGDDDELKLRAEVGKVQRALLQFDLSSIPANAIVTSAKLELYVTSDRSGVTVNVHRLTGDWQEGTGQDESGADWDHHDDPNAWATPGGDFDPTISGSLVPDTENVWIETDVTSMVYDWVDGSHANDGLALDPIGASGDFKFGSRDKNGKEPRLDVTYTTPPDTDIPTLIGADVLHGQGTDGSGVTVAVIDTGYWSHPGLANKANG